MKILYEDVKKQIANAKIGSEVEVLVANGTRRNGSSPYYTRRGILVNKTEDTITVLIGKRNFNIKLCHGIDWVGEINNRTSIKNEYASNLYNITTVAE